MFGDKAQRQSSCQHTDGEPCHGQSGCGIVNLEGFIQIRNGKTTAYPFKSALEEQHNGKHQQGRIFQESQCLLERNAFLFLGLRKGYETEKQDAQQHDDRHGVERKPIVGNEIIEQCPEQGSDAIASSQYSQTTTSFIIIIDVAHQCV